MPPKAVLMGIGRSRWFRVEGRPRIQKGNIAPLHRLVSERDVRGVCVSCGGPGKLADGTYCSCIMGRDLEKLARRDKAQPAKNGFWKT